jgi:hypothetical protein
MAKVKEMTFSKALKLSHGYNSFNVDFGITLALEEDDYNDMDGVKAKGWNTVDNEIDKQLPKIIEILTQLGE